MKQNRHMAAGVLTGLALWAVVVTNLYAIDDTIIAIVNDDVITLNEFQDYLATQYLQLLAEGKNGSQIDRILAEYEETGVQRLIEMRLLVNEANLKGLTVREELVSKRVDQIKGKYPSEQDFLKALSQDGLTVTDLRNRITDQLKIKFLVEEEIRSKIVVNPPEVTAYYQAHLNEFQKPERMDLDCIYIPYGEDPAAARQKATEALRLLNAGEEFPKVAQNYSAAPSLGIVPKGQLLPIVEEAVFSLKEEEVSSLIEMENGIYIFKLKAKLPAETMSLEEAKGQIYDTLFEKKFQNRYQDWLGKLEDRAYIEIKNDISL